MSVGSTATETAEPAPVVSAQRRGSLLLRRALRLAYDLYFERAKGEVRLFRGLYPDYAAARAATPAGRPIGYDNPETAWRVAHERHRIFDTDYPMLFWLGRLFPAARRVFDLGGNVGISYYAWRRYLDYPEGLDWLVCEVPNVAEAGRKLAGQEDAPGLRFTTTHEELASADVLISAGALQFIEDPFAILASVRLPRHVLLNKTSLYDRDDAATVQTVGSAFCPYHLFNRARFLAFFERRGYRVVDAWTNPGMTARIPFHPGHAVGAFSGLYLTRD
jgi:putative methyltransferase (TIGR04325 family)